MPTEILGQAAPARELHFIFLADCSGSMSGEKIAQLNAGIESAIPEMRSVVSGRPVRVMVRAIRFADQATWHVSQPTPLEQVGWTELRAGGQTAMGAAIDLAVGALDQLGGKQYAPVLVLVSDGHATDDMPSALTRLVSSQYGKRAIRRAVAIGDDADLDALRTFIGDPEVDVLQVDRPQDLAAAMRFVSVKSLSKASLAQGVTPPSSSASSSVQRPPTPGASGTGAGGTNIPGGVF